MAKKDNGNNSVGLLRYLTFEREARDDDQFSHPIKTGRIKYFFNTFKQYNGNLMFPNLLFVVTMLPMLAAYVILQIFTVEKISYYLNGITDLPYLMSSIGIGISSSSDILSAKLDILNVYQIYFLALAAGFVILSIGLAGLMRISMKFIWGDSFITKKDSYGNNVPRSVIEFFGGIKKYWWQMLLMGIIGFVFIAGVSSGIIYFISNLWAGTAGAGQYILLIICILAGLLGLLFLLYFPSIIVMYDIPFIDKIKNSLILGIQMFVPNLIILIIMTLPILLVSLLSGFLNVLLVALIIVFGGTFYSLLTGTYVQYYAEKIIIPVAYARFNKTGKKKKK